MAAHLENGRTRQLLARSLLLSENGRVKTHVETRSITKLLFFENSLLVLEQHVSEELFSSVGAKITRNRDTTCTLKSALLTSPAGGFVLQTIKVSI